LPHDIMALYQPDGGFLAPEKCIIAYCFEAMNLGAEIHGREAVIHWEPLPHGEGVRVHTERAIYEADSLVVTAGAWNDDLLRFLRGLAVPERQALAWFHPQRPDYFLLDNFPVFNLLVDEGRFYGFPVHAVPGFKIGKYHHLNEVGHADVLSRDVTPEDEVILRECVARYFPQAAGPTMTLKACLFTNAPDGHFLLDLHPDYPQVSYASACSGHGFKFGSVIGEILADLAQYRQTRHNIELFTHERFQGRAVHHFSGEHGALVPTGNTAVRRHALRAQQATSHSPLPTPNSSFASHSSARRVQEQMERIRSLW
jgi:sarcosine oxidase